MVKNWLLLTALVVGSVDAARNGKTAAARRLYAPVPTLRRRTPIPSVLRRRAPAPAPPSGGGGGGGGSSDGSALCNALPTLPGASCATENGGLKISYSKTIDAVVLKTDLTATFKVQPCCNPASASLSVTNSKPQKSIDKSIGAGSQTAIPIPGAVWTIPEVYTSTCLVRSGCPARKMAADC